MLQGKKILLGVTGSIAAYKITFLVRELIKNKAEVKVIMTTSALDFITPLTLATLSKNPVHFEFVKNKNGEWTNHVDLGLWADIFIVAPATANTISKLANGICDNLLSAVYLSARCPVMIAPAMDLDMYQHAAVQSNLQRLTSYNNTIIDANFGELASGLIGKGRMAEPLEIFFQIQSFFNLSHTFLGKKIVITAGPTYEYLDPVRFLGNLSTGKMGYSIAENFAAKGADVTIISGPVQIKASPNIKIISVTSALEMLKNTKKEAKNADIILFAAAVADYRPKEIATNKIKKNTESTTLELIKNPDIASEIGKIKTKNQLTIGFALETENEQENALKKLSTKNLDLIILNSLNDKGAGFSHDTNKITIFEKNKITKFELKSKKEVANDIVEAIAKKNNC